MKILLGHTFEDIISHDNLIEAWLEFECGKRNKWDVRAFRDHLFENINALHEELLSGEYMHGAYTRFYINDPKSREIHKAQVRDRVVHHALHRILYPFFETKFIADSFSARVGKGTHSAMDRFTSYSCKVSRNNTRTCYVLKCDIRKFFASIDHAVLYCILEDYIPDRKILWLLSRIIGSFKSSSDKGLPLGNLTSQLFANIYMNLFDQYIKHDMRVPHYIRYADDFVLLSQDRSILERTIDPIQDFLSDKLKLSLHPNKVSIRTIASGVDYLGWVHFADHHVLRATTRRRMFKKLSHDSNEATLQSYLGLLSHGNTHKIRTSILNDHWLLDETG
ncbi:MAG: reverse transcriptase domain-containing protein [bacterium]|nr:reverse transcriptase domain-containing protein [bacterium]